jgi:hypothetical protein
MSALRRLASGTVTLGVLLAAGPSFAGDPAAAQALFDDAKKLTAEGSWAAACPKLEESQRLDPGMGTEFNLATCHEHVGRNATAWAEYLDVAASAKLAGQPAREKAARERAALLEKTLSRVTVTVTREVPGLVVTRDGAEVGRGQWGEAVPLDPGAHTLSARAPGKKPWERTLRVLADGRTLDVAVPPLDDAPAPPLAAAATAPTAPSPSTRSFSDAAPSADAAPPGRGARIAGATLVIAGLAGMGVGASFGIVSKGKHDDAQGHCDGANRCDAVGLGLQDDAFRAGTVSTIAFAAGGAAVVTGAILWLTAPSARSTPPTSSASVRAAPLLGPNGMGLTVSGRFF